MPTLQFDRELYDFAKKLLEDDEVQIKGMKADEDLFPKLYEKFHQGRVHKRLKKVI